MRHLHLHSIDEFYRNDLFKHFNYFCESNHDAFDFIHTEKYVTKW